MPAIMAFAFIIGVASMLILSRSKAERNVLRIGVDYFQVLAMLRTAKVAWPIEDCLCCSGFSFSKWI